MSSAWHAQSKEDVLRVLETDAQQGLSEPEAAKRLSSHGSNELVEQGIKSPWSILWEQLTAFLVIVLIVGAILSLAVGEWKDAIAILVIVVLNALLGLSQEYRAEKAMAALKRLAVPVVRVRRGGVVLEISAKDLVPGDVVLLEAGSHVPADGRLVEMANLMIQEAALTGESAPVEKHTDCDAEQANLADRRSMAYLGTAVTYGRGVMVVTDTGMATELGRIATMLQSVESEPTPLQLRLDELGRILTAAACAIIAVVGAVLFFRDVPLKEIFLTAVSMAVAAVPEGLPAMVTISLALGAQRMLKKRVLIRRLTAVETLGSVTVVCSDKTGTLTENRMTVIKLALSGREFDFNAGRTGEEADASILLGGAALACDAALREAKDGAWSAVGDPTEGALVIAAAQVGLCKPDLDRLFPRVAEVPFDSIRKRMTTVHETVGASAEGSVGILATWIRSQGSRVAFTKGSVDGLAQLCTHVLEDGRIEILDATRREGIIAENNRLAADGIRVLGLAFRCVGAEEEAKPESLERNLVFVGMTGLIDPVRVEVPPAVHLCRQAGIVPMMITGDHPLTARHIARELDLPNYDNLLQGHDLDTFDDAQLSHAVENTFVYARVAPEHKLRIVERLQEHGHVVAMTGDGVNDAPALKKANIGVAMGISGTDVSKEASAMVLQDDNFASIVAAVEEGRVIYDNIRRFMRYMLGTNTGELWVMLIGPILGMSLPLIPVQILWMNLVTDGLPGLALALEPGERDVMRRPPRRHTDSIIGWAMGLHVIWVGLLMAVVTLGAGFYFWTPGDESSWHQAQTMIFTIIVFLQLGHAMAIRSTTTSTFQLGFLSNPALLGAVGLMVLLQTAVVYVPALQTFFGTTSMPPSHFLLCLALGSSVFWAVEIEKWVARRTGRTLA